MNEVMERHDERTPPVTLTEEEIKALVPHEYCDIMPRSTREEYEGLRDKIKAHGLWHPIVLYQGKILDGKHRNSACGETSVAPRYVEFKGSDKEALDLVVDLNTTQRTLTTGQRALIGHRTKPIYAALAQERMAAGGRSNTKVEGVRNSSPLPEKVDFVHGQGFKARDAAAAAVGGVSGDSIDTAGRVVEEGIPEVVDALEVGDMSLNEAEKIAKLPRAKQKEVVEKIAKLPKDKKKNAAPKKERSKVIAEATGVEPKAKAKPAAAAKPEKVKPAKTKPHEDRMVSGEVELNRRLGVLIDLRHRDEDSARGRIIRDVEAEWTQLGKTLIGDKGCRIEVREFSDDGKLLEDIYLRAVEKHTPKKIEVLKNRAAKEAALEDAREMQEFALDKAAATDREISRIERLEARLQMKYERKEQQLEREADAKFDAAVNARITQMIDDAIAGKTPYLPLWTAMTKYVEFRLNARLQTLKEEEAQVQKGRAALQAAWDKHRPKLSKEEYRRILWCLATDHQHPEYQADAELMRKFDDASAVFKRFAELGK